MHTVQSLLMRVWICQSVGTPVSVRVTADLLVEDVVKTALTDIMKSDVPLHMVLVKFEDAVVKKDVSVTALETTYDNPLRLQFLKLSEGEAIIRRPDEFHKLHVMCFCPRDDYCTCTNGGFLSSLT